MELKVLNSAFRAQLSAFRASALSSRSCYQQVSILAFKTLYLPTTL